MERLSGTISLLPNSVISRIGYFGAIQLKYLLGLGGIDLKNIPITIQCKTEIMIIHHEIDLEFELQATYLIITEVENGKPCRIYSYKIPDEYKNDIPLSELVEKYNPYCPN
jgi:hypothetical protein